ncbi:hypothetical protein N9L68_06670, partial [bacterium]|nr:hypothetical protein [bacterium]
GAFLNVKIPDGKVVIIQPPAQWVKWGLVKPGVTWILDKAVYELRESPALWGEERDKKPRTLKLTVGSHQCYMEHSTGDLHCGTSGE